MDDVEFINDFDKSEFKSLRFEQIEVIGNIFENPELIHKQNYETWS